MQVFVPKNYVVLRALENGNDVEVKRLILADTKDDLVDIIKDGALLSIALKNGHIKVATILMSYGVDLGVEEHDHSMEGRRGEYLLRQTQDSLRGLTESSNNMLSMAASFVRRNLPTLEDPVVKGFKDLDAITDSQTLKNIRMNPSPLEQKESLNSIIDTFVEYITNGDQYSIQARADKFMRENAKKILGSAIVEDMKPSTKTPSEDNIATKLQGLLSDGLLSHIKEKLGKLDIIRRDKEVCRGGSC